MTTEQFVKSLLDETRDEINRADTKASILLAGIGVATAAGSGALAGSRFSLSGERGAVQALAGAAAVLVFLGLFLLGAAVLPRIGKAAPGRARYFMDHAQYASVSDLRDAVTQEASDAAGRHLRQLYDLSKIVRRKYRCTRFGELVVGFGIALGLAAVVAHLVLHT